MHETVSGVPFNLAEIRVPRLSIATALIAGAALVLGALPPQSAPAQAPPGPCAAAPRAGSATITLTSGGVKRSAVLHLPPVAAGRAFPLVIALHGYGDNGASFERETGLDTVADRDHFAALYPSSLGPTWQINGRPRDVQFISSLLDTVQSQACVDPLRIYAMGVSNGGGMAAVLGCELSYRIAAIAPIAGGYRSLPACAPGRPVSLLEVHGTADTTVPYSGQPSTGAGDVLAYVFGWVFRDGCSQTPIKQKVADHALLYRWSGCGGGAVVEHLRIYGGGHGLPGAVSSQISSGNRTTIDGIEQVWRFFAPLVLAPAPAPAAAPASGDPDQPSPSA